MGILHIFLAVLKITGILLLVILGLFLAVLIMVLFCPVRYRVWGEKEAEEMKGGAKASWLFGAVSLRLEYAKGKAEPAFEFRLLGLPCRRIWKFFLEIKKRGGEKQSREGMKKKKKDREFSRDKEESSSPKALPGEEEAVKREAAERAKPEAREEEVKGKKEEKGESFLKKAGSLWNMIKVLPAKSREVWKKFWLTAGRIYAKISAARDFLESGEFQRAKKLAFQEIWRLLRHSRPRKIRGQVEFGTEDPCLTGKILAAAGIFYPLYGESLSIEPYFDRKLFAGRIWLKGRIRGIHFALTAWRLFRSREVRFVVRRLKA